MRCSPTSVPVLACLLVGMTSLYLSPPPAASATTFTDVTTGAGVDYLQYTLVEQPNCLMDPFAPNDPPMATLECIPERWTGGASVGDYDNDGWTDLFVGVMDGPDILFRNRGDGTFEDVTIAAGLDGTRPSNGSGFVDVDNDRDLDLYVTTVSDTRFHLFINDGTGVFAEEGVARKVALDNGDKHAGTSVAFGDYNRDGFIDMFTTEWRPHSLAPGGSPTNNRLFLNRGQTQPGYFDEVTDAAGVSLMGVDPRGVFGFAPTFVDLDDDGWQDLAVVSDFGGSRLFWNNQDGTFTDGTVAAGVGTAETGMGSTFGDYDGDGDLDWFVSAIYCPRAAPGCSGSRLYQNEGGRLFTDQTDTAGVRDGNWGWGSLFFDHDNDTDLDIVETNGMIVTDYAFDDEFHNLPMIFFDNDGTGVMTERAAQVGFVSTDFGKGLLGFDYDRDGDVDVFVINNASSPNLYRNDGGNTNNWLRVDALALRSNRNSIGAKIELIRAEGEAAQVREIGVSSHYQGQSELTAHFGLGTTSTVPVREVKVTWPASGRSMTYPGMARNSTLLACEPADVEPLLMVAAGNDLQFHWSIDPMGRWGYDVRRTELAPEVRNPCGVALHFNEPAVTPTMPVVEIGAMLDATRVLYYQLTPVY